MRLIKKIGSDRVIDELRQALTPASSLDLASPVSSLFAFAELRDLLEKLDACRMVLPSANCSELGLTGSDSDRAFRNRLQLRWLARERAAWVKRKAEVRGAPASLPQSIFIAGKPKSELHRVITGNCAFTTEGLGITPGNQFSLIQCSEKPEESAILGSWFTSLWNTLSTSGQDKTADRASALRNHLDTHARHQQELTVLRAQVGKENQISRRVKLNLQIKRLEAQLDKVVSQL